jgi:hypothetical protein
MQEMLSNAADPKRSDDFFLNVIDNCPTAALLIKSSSTNIEKEVITFDVSNIFTSPILVSKVQDKIRAVSSMKAHWISDETRKLPEKLCMRKQISSEKSYRKGLNQVLKSITSGERMIFLLGASIDIISFQQLRNITEKFPNCVLCLDALWSPNEINIELKFDRDTILSTQFALLIGSSKGIDICDLYANLPNLRKVESVSLQDLTEFLQQYQGIQNLYTYNSPKFFLHSDLLGGRAFQDVLDTINNFATDYEQQIGKTPEIKVLPRSMTQIMIGDIDGYLNLSQLRDTRDIRFICIIGEVTQAARQIIDELYHDDDPIEIIQFSPFDQGYASFVPTRHFLEDSAQYLNIFGDIVETKACCNTALKSNRELTEDMGCMLTQLDKHVNGYRIA